MGHDTRRQELMAALTQEDLITTDNILNILIVDKNYCNGFIVALLNSNLISWLYTNRSAISVKDDFPQVTLRELKDLPIRKISFTTPEDLREKLVNELIDDYEREEYQTLLDKIEGILPKDDDGNFVAEEEKSDVVHDFLAFLAEKMIELNKDKQAEMKSFLEWLGREIEAEYKSKKGIDALTGKTKIQNYIGDYQKDEDALDFEELIKTLKKNKSRIKPDPAKRDFQDDLKKEYEKSLQKLLPLKKQLKQTDDLIDQVVYKLYGLKEEEVRVLEMNL